MKRIGTILLCQLALLTLSADENNLYDNHTSSNDNNHTMNTTEGWLNHQLNEKNAPLWLVKYIFSLDSRIDDPNAKAYYRRFLYDSGNRSDSLLKFVEYLSLAGYPSEKMLDHQNHFFVQPIDLYKAIYFALTYTIMDGLPVGPLDQVDLSDSPQQN